MKGYVLLQVLVFALFVSAVSAALVSLTMSRRVLAQRRDAGVQGRAVLEAVHARALACLPAKNGSACVQPASGCEAVCGLACVSAFGPYKLSLGGRQFSVRANLAGTASACRIEAACVDCPGPDASE